METFLEFALTTIISIVVGAVLGIAAIYTRNRSAPRRYFNRVKGQLDRAIAEGQEGAIKNAKIIVASRNSLRDSLSSLGWILNSEIDRLEFLIITVDRPGRSEPHVGDYRQEIDPSVVYKQLIVLKGYWEAKEDVIEGAIKKVLVDLNII